METVGVLVVLFAEVGHEALDEPGRVIVVDDHRTRLLRTNRDELRHGVRDAPGAGEDANELAFVIRDCELSQGPRVPSAITTMSDERMFSTSRPINPEPV